MSPSDGIRIGHMLEAAREALALAAGSQRSGLDHDRKLVLAVIKRVEIVGEAASKTSAEFRTQNPQIPWAAIVGMRNRLVHVYFDIDLDRVWDTITDDLPQLIAKLEKLPAE